MGAQRKIFISYRREDAPGDARGVCDRLGREFGKANVFMDVDRLLAGQRFDRELDKALSQCDVLIAIIGPRWMASLSEHALSGERDFVHDEIVAALKRDIIVIPVLIGREGHMPPLPRKDDLPEDIRDLVLYQKHDIAHESFNRDTDHLTAAIASVLRGGQRAVPWRGIGISGGIVLVLIAALLVYGTGMFWPSPSNLPPNQGIDGGIRITQDRAAAEEADRKKAADEASKRAAADAAAKKAADESVRKIAAEEEANRKAAEETRRQAEADAAKKKAAEDAASKKAAEEAARSEAFAKAARQTEADAAKKKSEDEAANNKAAAECDRLAASPFDTTRPNGVPGIDLVKLDPVAATAACSDAMRRYPEVARFVFQAGRAADVRQDYARALELYRKASAGGSAAAMNGIGELYLHGEGVAREYSEARKWFEKGAALGNADAMTNLGFIYTNGHGVVQNYREARQWYEKAAALGNRIAMRSLGVFSEGGHGGTQDYVEASKWYEKAAALGEQGAMVNLGILYSHGNGVAKDYAKTREWYEKAAALGDADAMSGLGLLYDNGDGIPQDYAKAREWYEKGAALGSSTAMFNLGMLYEEGQGVSKNVRQAHQWFQKAADAGSEPAKAKLKKRK